MFCLLKFTTSLKEDFMRKVQLGLAIAAVMLMALTGCTAKLAKEDRDLLNQALTASQSAAQSAQAAEASAVRANTAATRAEAAAQKADAAAQSAAASAGQAQTAAAQAEQSALKAQKAFEMGMKK
jgi:uncharacterized iron-regulated membrane protein